LLRRFMDLRVKPAGDSVRVARVCFHSGGHMGGLPLDNDSWE
jgi:hypothetical protein